MLDLDLDILTTISAQALEAAAEHPRWTAAIKRAITELESNPYIARDSDGLLIGSSSGRVYCANGVCQCEAYAYGQPCWHRAAARLVRRYDEAYGPGGIEEEPSDPPNPAPGIEAPTGRHIAQLLIEDRPTLAAILSGTRADVWPDLARSYLSAIGVTDAQPSVPGILYVWRQIVKEHS